jgi:ADP-ribose pyrophosphatase YjhB (NUDIX family)
LTTDPAARFATPRIASGALFVDQGRLLLVRKTYGDTWDIPGGYVDRGESPAAACERELREELGLYRTARRLLVNDWAPNTAEGDKILYIFDCGNLGEDERSIRLDHVEVDKTEWVAVEKIARFVIPRLVRRLTNAYRAYTSDATLYLEHGKTPSTLKLALPPP